MSKNCPYCTAVIEPSMKTCSQCGAPNEFYVPPGSSPLGNIDLNDLVAKTGAWKFEGGVRDFGGRLVSSMGLSRAGSPPSFIELLVRGAFLDGEAYRYAARDLNGNANAFLALALPAIGGLIGGLLAGSHLSFYTFSVTSTVLLAVIGYGATLAAIAVMAAFSQAVLHTKLNFGEVLRGLAYAQSPGILAILPIVGTLLSLWRIVTSIVAMREISGTNAVKSAILLAIGLVTTIIVSAMLSPLVVRSALL